ncbi:MAG: tRNA pseudouridine(38-40) synthase TruA [Acidobacteriota bacterium]|nr:tRNA pseudouridine(38-40) synthase TruA [Blastocatellia bacterium]MDW8413367.1 tRNA pseudouridine(38-40) synthase TruA [Acidobacteriota bacterium]
MRNIRLTLQYDGTNYSGWQVQASGRPTVQGTLLAVLRRIEGREVKLHAAGRTDAGVHALAQVANYFSAKHLPCDNLKRAINASLPPDIRVTDVAEVDASFHARYCAKLKTYRYTIVLSQTVSPFEYRYVYHYPYKLDTARIKEAARLMVGKHDFASFATAIDRDIDTVRTVTSIEVMSNEDRLMIEVTGDGFLRYMVRTMVGTLLEVGRSRLGLDDVVAALKSRDRSLAGETLPAQGLTLVAVHYED